MGLYWDDGKENGSYCSMLWLYWDNGKEDGSHYSILGLYWDNGTGICHRATGFPKDKGSRTVQGLGLLVTPIEGFQKITGFHCCTQKIHGLLGGFLL